MFNASASIIVVNRDNLVNPASDDWHGEGLSPASTRPARKPRASQGRFLDRGPARDRPSPYGKRHVFCPVAPGLVPLFKKQRYLIREASDDIFAGERIYVREKRKVLAGTIYRHGSQDRINYPD